jgi:three-Cys-motif partner protein
MKTTLYEGREQTLVKHKLLERYLLAAIPIIGSWANDIYFLDCLAGPWKSASGDLSDTSFSVAVEALRRSKSLLASRGKHPSMRCLFIEQEPGPFAELKKFCDGVNDIEVVAKNWDFEHHVDDVVTSVRRRGQSFPFFFIDPKGWECAAIPLLTPILSLEPGEVIINLMTSWISRFLSDSSKDFTKLVGSEVTRIASLQGDSREYELVRCYSEAVRKAGGFPYVCTMPVLKSTDEKFHFHMIYATRSQKGVEEFKKAERDVVPLMHGARADAQVRKTFQATGQFPLLQPIDTYQESRYTRYKESNLSLAKEAAANKLTTSVSFDVLWAEWMQFACVQDDDLQAWIREREKAGEIEIRNLPIRSKKLSRGKNIMVVPI